MFTISCPLKMVYIFFSLFVSLLLMLYSLVYYLVQHYCQFYYVTLKKCFSISSSSENQRKVLLQTMVQAPGHSSPVFNDKILALYKQSARIAHVCYTPLLFLPR